MMKKLIGGVALLSLIGFGVMEYNGYAIAKDDDNQTQTATQPPAMPVNIEVMKPQSVKIWRGFSARIEAVEFADIRPQVSGRITDIKFNDGQLVNKGDVLYVIDPRPYKATLNQAKAELSAAKTDLNLANKELNRANGLIKTNAISQRILDERQSHVQSARATVDRAKAMVEQAQINLDYAYIKAPFSGKVGRADIKIGNVVEANVNAPVLTSIVATDHVYADFEVDEQTYLKLVKTGNTDIPVELSLGSDASLTYTGVIDSFDNQLDINSGTIRARAKFDNKDNLLIPGMFAHVNIAEENDDKVILVNETAIGTDQDRKFVYVVDDQNMVQYQEVSLGEGQKGRRVVTKGLKEGDKVIVDGLIKIRPNMPVDPKIKAEG